MELYRNRTKEREIKQRQELEEKEATLEKLTALEEESRNKVYDEANRASTAQCLMDQSCKKLANVPCNSCVHREGSLGPCKSYAKELPCVKWNTTCATFDNVCAKHENFCKNETMVCYEWGQECLEKAPVVCESWTEICPAGSMAGWAFDKKEWCGRRCSNKCGGTWGNPCCKAEGGYGWEECEMRCRNPEKTCAKHSPDSCIKFASKCLKQGKECAQYEVIKMIETQQMRTYDELRELDIEETPESLR